MNISVVIPTFNRRRLLCRALDSVNSQRKTPFEVIVVDDGSDDGTQQMIAKRYRDVVYLHQSNQGVSSARNRGIKSARGDWIALLDSDDEWFPEKLGLQSGALDANTDFQICHTDEIWIRHGKRVNQMHKHEKSGGWIYEKCLPLCVISPSSVLIHCSVFQDVGYFDEQLPACEDYDLWLRICAFYQVLYLDQPLVRKYGGHEDQLSRRFWGMDRFRITAMEKMLAARNLDDRSRSATSVALQQKLEILLAGARKHGNTEVFDEYSIKLEAAAGGKWVRDDD